MNAYHRLTLGAHAGNTHIFYTLPSSHIDAKSQRKNSRLFAGIRCALQYLTSNLRGSKVCHSVRLSVTTFSPAMRNKTAKKWYQQVQCHTGFILKIVILVKMLRSKVMVWSKVKELICKWALAYLGQLCVVWKHQKLQRRMSIDSHVLQCSKPVTDSQPASW